MKKYIIPATKVINADISAFICASPLGERKASWGAKGNNYANDDWYDQGYSQGDDGEFMEDDEGVLNSQ